MDGERKYRQNGYQNGSSGHGNEPRNEPRNEPTRDPRHPIDFTAQRLPHMVQNITASRCYDCGYALPAGFDFVQPCPKCAVELQCCKQCAHFDSSAHFQCAKPIPERIAAKDKRNECPLFTPRVTVARDSTPAPAPPAPPKAAESPAAPYVSRTVHNARTAFENLFKK